MSCCPHAYECHADALLQLFEYILEYLRTVRFGEPDHSLALPADQTELAQIVREVSILLSHTRVVADFAATAPRCH